MSRRRPGASSSRLRGRAPERVPVAPARPAVSFSWKIYGWAVLVLLVLAAIFAGVVYLRPLAVLDAITRARLAYKGFRNEYVTIDGNRIHYYEAGSVTNPPVLLVHGLGGRAEDWANLAPLLRDAGFHIYAIDLLGYGRSERPASAPYSIPAEAALVERFMTVRGLRSVDLAGWSMGGWVALRVALDVPDRVRTLMLFDAAGVRFTPNFDASLFQTPTPAAMQRLYDRLVPHPKPLPGFLLRAMVRRGAEHGWVSRRSAASMFTGADLLDSKLGAIKKPVLIVWGRQDALLPLSMGETMHREIPQSSLAVVDGCGHLAAGQCAPQIAPTVIEFLRGSGPQPGATVELK